MAPTSEILTTTPEHVAKGWPSTETSPSTEKEQLRPPVYNPEDYAAALRKWGRRLPAGKVGSLAVAAAAATAAASVAATAAAAAVVAAGASPTPATVGSALSTSSLSASMLSLTLDSGEMTLRQFDSVAVLLDKLQADLKLAFPSFVQEFIESAVDGITLLLELLRSVQPGSGDNTGAAPGTPPGLPPQPVTGAAARQGLLHEHACLQCLTACLRCPDAPRRLAVSPAGLFTLTVSIMSPATRSRILALRLLARVCEAAVEGHSAVSEALSTMRLRFGEPVRFRFVAGVLGSAGGQRELLAAGLRFLNAFVISAGDPQQKVFIQAELGQAGFNVDQVQRSLSSASAGCPEVQAELASWRRQLVDVAALGERARRAEQRATHLEAEVAALRGKLRKLEAAAALAGRFERDEGISSSEALPAGSPDGCPDGCPDGTHDEDEATIEEVMEEFQNIISDAESAVALNGHDAKPDPPTPGELDIVPTKLLPQPPRRDKSLTHLYVTNGTITKDCDVPNTNGGSPFFDDGETFSNVSGDNSDSLLSARAGYRSVSIALVNGAMPDILRCSSGRRRSPKTSPTSSPSSGSPPQAAPRCSSFDGLFYVAEPARNNLVQPLARRTKSKSLECVDEGLNSLVDIVVTPSPASKPSSETPRRPRQPQPAARSTSVRLQAAAPLPGQQQPRFLPVLSRIRCLEGAAGASLVVKRGSVNAGRYSAGSTPASTALTSQPMTSMPVFGGCGIRGLRGVCVDLGAPSARLSDLPSGLY